MSITHWLKVASVLIVIGASVSGVGLLVQNAASSTQPPPEGDHKAARTDNLPVLEVKPGKFSVTVVERGSLESSNNKDAYCLVEGVTTIIMILPEGTRVKKGDVVCELDSAALRDRLVNQHITTKRAESDYAGAKLDREVAEIAVIEYAEGIYPQEKETLTGKISTATSSIQRADARLARTRAAEKQLHDAMAARPASTSADILAKLDIEDRIAAAEQTLEQQKITLDLAKTEQKVLEDYTRGKTTKALQIAVERKRSDELGMKAAWELESSKERKLERQIAYCIIKAPGDGLVVYGNDPRNIGNRPPQIEEGATVRERQLIFRLPDITRMQVNAKVRELHVDRLLQGMKARVRVDAFADAVLSGTVRDIAPLPDRQVPQRGHQVLYDPRRHR